MIDDDPMVLEVVSAMLEDRGHRVFAAGDVSSALDIAREAEEIDIILSDVLMPEGNGPGIVARVRELFPAAKVLHMSGHTGDVAIRDDAAEPAAAFIQKPFTGDELAARVRQLLQLRRP